MGVRKLPYETAPRSRLVISVLRLATASLRSPISAVDKVVKSHVRLVYPEMLGKAGGGHERIAGLRIVSPEGLPNPHVLFLLESPRQTDTRIVCIPSAGRMRRHCGETGAIAGLKAEVAVLAVMSICGALAEIACSSRCLISYE